MRVTHIALVLTLVLLSSQVEAEDDFSFDHAFRRFEKFLERQEAKKVVKEEVKAERRMGLAHEEDEEEAEGEKTEVFKKHSFLRRAGDILDQDAVETKGLRQFSSGNKKKSPLSASRRNDGTESIRPDAAAMPRRSDSLQASRRSGSTGENKRSDTTAYPKAGEHRGPNMSSYAAAAEKARTTLVLATNNALEGTTIATYLTQMWMSNIMQTIGFAALGILFSSGTARSFPSSPLADGHEASSGDFDFKSIISMVRGLADFADNIHDEF